MLLALTWVWGEPMTESSFVRTLCKAEKCRGLLGSPGYSETYNPPASIMGVLGAGVCFS